MTYRLGHYYLFEVIGKRQYRGHQPGERFVSRLDPALERAVQRPNVVVLAEVETSIKHREHGLPRDWPREANAPADTEAPKGAFFMREGG